MRDMRRGAACSLLKEQIHAELGFQDKQKQVASDVPSAPRAASWQSSESDIGIIGHEAKNNFWFLILPRAPRQGIA